MSIIGSKDVYIVNTKDVDCYIVAAKIELILCLGNLY